MVPAFRKPCCSPENSEPLHYNLTTEPLSKPASPISEMGLGRAKTSAVAPHIEISPSNCISGSQIILHTRGSMPCWRIVFSTFRGCMSFYTARVIRDRDAQTRMSCTSLRSESGLRDADKSRIGNAWARLLPRVHIEAFGFLSRGYVDTDTTEAACSLQDAP
jgi:hypothetical protein